MSTPGIIANMARGWNRDPQCVSFGSERTGVSAALWEHNDDGAQEVWAEPDDRHHIIALQLGSPIVEVVFDQRRVFSGRVPTGGFQIVEAGVRPHMITKGPWRILHVYLPKLLVERFVEAEGFAADPQATTFIDPRCGRDSAVERVGREVLSEMRDGAALTRLRIDALSQDLSILLLRRHSNLAGAHALRRDTEKSGLASWRVKRAADRMLADLSEDVSLADLAAEIGLSPYHFCRAFARSTGLPPHRWRLARRIERACALLEATDLPVGVVAAQVGYDDPNQLARVFRRALGVSPTQYRRERCR